MGAGRRRGVRSVHLHVSHAPLTRMLDHHLPFGRRSTSPALTQHLPPLGRQLLEPAEILPNRRLLVGGVTTGTYPTDPAAPGADPAVGSAIVENAAAPVLVVQVSCPTSGCCRGPAPAVDPGAGYSNCCRIFRAASAGLRTGSPMARPGCSEQEQGPAQRAREDPAVVQTKASPLRAAPPTRLKTP